MWIRIRSDPHSFGSVDLDPDPHSEWRSGSRGIKLREKQSSNFLKSETKKVVSLRLRYRFENIFLLDFKMVRNKFSDFLPWIRIRIRSLLRSVPPTLAARRSVKGLRAPSPHSWTICSTVPPEVRLVTAQAASFWAYSKHNINVKKYIQPVSFKREE